VYFGGGDIMAIMKFKKGKNDRTVIGGLGDNSAHFDGTTYAETKELDLYKAKYDLLISLWVWLDDNVESDSPQAIFSYGVMGSRTTSPYNSVTIVVKDLQIEPYLALTFDKETYYHEIFKLADNTNGKLFLPKKEWVHFGIGFDPSGYGTILLYKNGVFFGSKYNDQVPWLNITKTILSIGKPYGTSLSQYINFKGNVKNVQIFSSQGAVDMNKIIPAIYNGEEAPITSYYKTVSLPLQAGQDDDSLFKSKSFVYDTGKVETSSGFNSLGKPIRYRSASGAGIAYFTLPVKDGLVFCSNYKKGAIDTVSKASAECNNVVFEKYNGVDCAYFNGTSSSIIWKNVLTKSLTKYTLVVKFACTYTNGSWRFLFGVSPENNRGQGCSLQMHNESGNRFYFLWGSQDYSVASNVEKEVFHVGILSVDNGLIKCYLDNNLVYNGNLGAKEIPSTSLLYVGGDYGQSYRLWFEGYIAQSILYDRALNEDEVKALSEV
jgi:hypothetical protein